MPNILIAESGSTKTDWVYINEQGEKSSFLTAGLNPNYVNKAFFLNETALLPKEVTHLFFYGAGCDAEEQQMFLRSEVFQQLWPLAVVELGSDLWGAVRGALGNHKGVVGILGTGSNITYFDGTSLNGIAAPGYLLADEGGGTFIGRRVLNKFFRKQLGAEAQLYIEKNIGTPKAILNQLYVKKEGIPYFLAQCAKVMQFYHNDPVLYDILQEAMQAYYAEQIQPLQQKQNFNEMALVGSIAFFFEKEWRAFLKERNIILNRVVQKPIDGLVQYCQQKLS